MADQNKDYVEIVKKIVEEKEIQIPPNKDENKEEI